MKKILVMSLVLLILLLNGLALASDFQGTIQLWDYPHGKSIQEWWDQVITEFETNHPNVKIEFTQLTWAGGNQKVDVAVASGMLPDIVLQGTKMKYIKQDVLEDLTPYFVEKDLKDFYPAAIKGYKYKGGIYGWPWYLFPYHLYLNADLFAECGVELPENGRWTYDQFIDDMKQLTFDRDGDGKIDVYGWTYNVQPDYYDVWPIMLSDGAKVFNEEMTKFTLNSPEGISGLQKLINFENNYNIALPNSAGMDQSQQMTAFTRKRKVATTATGVWGVGSINYINKELQEKIDKGEDTEGKEFFNLAVANYPIGDLGYPISFVLNGGFAVFKQKDQAKLDTIVEFLKFVTSAEKQEEVAKDFMGFVPSRKAVSGDKIYGDDKNMKEVLKMMDTAQPWPPLIPEWDKIGEKIQRQIQLACLGEITAEDALRNAERDVQRILNKINRKK